MKKHQKDLDNIVWPKTIAAGEYRKIVKSNLEENWMKNKKRSKVKVNHLKKKFSIKIQEKHQN